MLYSRMLFGRPRYFSRLKWPFPAPSALAPVSFLSVIRRSSLRLDPRTRRRPNLLPAPVRCHSQSGAYEPFARFSSKCRKISTYEISRLKTLQNQHLQKKGEGEGSRIDRSLPKFAALAEVALPLHWRPPTPLPLHVMALSANLAAAPTSRLRDRLRQRGRVQPPTAKLFRIRTYIKRGRGWGLAKSGYISPETLTFTDRLPARRLLLRGALDAGGGIAVVLVVLLHLRGDAHHFHHVVIGRLQPHGKFVQGHPRLGVHLQVINGYGELQVVVVHTVEAFLDVHGIASRAAGSIRLYQRVA